jgi:glycosyltransferase involved in cell wall biosynthesis
MNALVQREIASGSYDIIHADQLWMAQYGLLGAGSGARLVLDEHNACFQIFQRLAQGEKNPLKRLVLEREWKALKRYEAQACACFDRLVTVTEEDRVILEELVQGAGGAAGGSPVFATIPICVDTASILPVTPQDNSQDVLLLGTMFWPPNIEGALWFARQVWPRVRQRLPQATFTLVGKNPPEAVRALQSEGTGIRITGYVPDPLPYLERAAAFVVPLFSAGGMRVKIVDGWRWGLPVVSTSIGAEGIRYTDSENILIRDDAEGFAEAIIRLLQDQEMNRKLRQNGRRWVEEKYDWERVYPAWEEVYR